MSRPPTYGAMVVPRELRAWARFRRLDAVAELPRIET